MGCYLKRTVKAGRIIEVQKYYAARFGGHSRTRSPNREKTPADVERVNEKNAIEKLRWLINANFGYGDYHLILTYRTEARPKSKDEMRENVEVFLRHARKLYRCAGKVLRYAQATECKSKAPHHHLVITGFDLMKLQEIWPHGRIRCYPLDNSGDYTVLAQYIIKETRKTFRENLSPWGKRWCASRNLVQPEIKTEVVHAESWRKAPKAIKGYILVPDSVEVGVHEVTGQAWQRYWMRRIE